MLHDFVNLNLFGFFLIFARVGTVFSMLPGFAAAYVSIRIRLLLALSVSFVLAPVLADSLPGRPASIAQLGVLLAAEVFVGIFLATLARVFIGALQTAGTFIALFGSLASALIQDPIVEQQSSTISGFLVALGLVLIFATGLDHLMLRAIVDSYSLFRPGEPLEIGDFSMMVSRWVADSFALGLQLALPFVIAAIVYYVGLGLLGRLMPALPVFFFGLPLQIALQFWIMAVSITGMMIVFLSRFQEGYVAFLKP